MKGGAKLSRRQALTMGAAAADATGTTMSSWPFGAASVATDLKMPTSVASGGPTSMSPVFAEVVPKLEGLWSEFAEASARYERLGEAFRRLRKQISPEVRGIYHTHPEVQAFHRASSALSAALRTAMRANPKTLTDCDAQEWCERVFKEVSDEEVIAYWQKSSADRMKYWRSLVRAGDNQILKAQLRQAYLNRAKNT
jgi:hypothetical protein